MSLACHPEVRAILHNSLDFTYSGIAEQGDYVLAAQTACRQMSLNQTERLSFIVEHRFMRVNQRSD